MEDVRLQQLCDELRTAAVGLRDGGSGLVRVPRLGADEYFVLINGSYGGVLPPPTPFSAETASRIRTEILSELRALYIFLISGDEVRGMEWLRSDDVGTISSGAIVIGPESEGIGITCLQRSPEAPSGERWNEECIGGLYAVATPLSP
jgi:hypothetical protein